MKRYYPHYSKLIAIELVKAFFWSFLPLIAIWLAIIINPNCYELWQKYDAIFISISIVFFLFPLVNDKDRFATYLEIYNDKIILYCFDQYKAGVHLNYYSRIEFIYYNRWDIILNVYYRDEYVNCIFSDFSLKDQLEMIDIFKSISHNILIVKKN